MGGSAFACKLLAAAAAIVSLAVAMWADYHVRARERRFRATLAKEEPRIQFRTDPGRLLGMPIYPSKPVFLNWTTIAWAYHEHSEGEIGQALVSFGRLHWTDILATARMETISRASSLIVWGLVAVSVPWTYLRIPWLMLVVLGAWIEIRRFRLQTASVQGLEAAIARQSQ